jgi:diguanylate cyclase (GGDEF)-like protein
MSRPRPKTPVDIAPTALPREDAAVPEHLYDCLPAAVFVIDVDSGQIVHANAGAVELSGFPLDQLVGRFAVRLFPRSDVSRFIDPQAEVRLQGGFLGWIRTRGKVDVAIAARISTVSGTSPRRALLVAFDITETRQQLDSLSERARIDTRTGLLQRDEFESALADMVLCRPGQNSSAALSIAFDGVQRLRDSLGREQGDLLLAELARRLREASVAPTLIARDGQDGILLVWNDLPPGLLEARQELDQRASALLASSRQPFFVQAVIMVCTCSIGIALAPHDADTPGALLHYADLARRQQQAEGHDGHHHFVNGDLRRVNDELEVESNLREALRHRNLEQRWLPVVRLSDGLCVGVEALLRGNEPLQRHEAGRIVAIAQARGLLPEVGRLSLRQAADSYAQLGRAGRTAAIQYFGLNLGADEVTAPGFVEELIETAQAVAMPLDRLMLEIGEADLTARMAGVGPPLHLLAEHGVRVAIDGFGSGFASMSTLGNLPVGMIKIDRRFVWQLEHNAYDREIVRTMIELAHRIDLRVTAVGVETAAQQQILRDLGCDFAQGYLYSRPLPLAELVEFLRPHAARAR